MDTVCTFLGITSFCDSVGTFFVSPLWSLIWFWLPIWLGTLALCWIVGWFFPVLRSVCGMVILVLTAFLVGLYKGQKDQKALQRERPKPKPKEQESFDPFGWMWKR